YNLSSNISICCIKKPLALSARATLHSMDIGLQRRSPAPLVKLAILFPPAWRAVLTAQLTKVRLTLAR
ncbi:MAG TPA: hypothetical protein QF359_08095, partial [Rhodospirillales bacterium]|nr:hypothetical protein [Rhodospirillales bacterium]